MSPFLSFTIFLHLCFISCDATDDFLSRTWLDGGAAFFRVKRDKLQSHLNALNTEYESDGISFYLPRKSVMQHVLGEDEHTIIVTMGREESVSFTQALAGDEEFTTHSKLFVVNVPFLSTRLDGDPEVSLLLNTYRLEDAAGKRVVDANAVVPSEVKRVEELVVTSDYLNFVEGDLEFVMEERSEDEECITPHVHDTEEMASVRRELMMSRVEPDFSICEEYPELRVDFCVFHRGHGAEIRDAGNNVCEYLLPSSDVVTCSTKFEVTRISPAMRELLFLEDGPVESIEAVVQSGTFDVHFKVPCLEGASRR